MNLPERSNGCERGFDEADVVPGGLGDSPRALTNFELESVAGGLNPMLIPSGIVAAVMAALDMDEYWIPYFNQKMDEAGK